MVWNEQTRRAYRLRVGVLLVCNMHPQTVLTRPRPSTLCLAARCMCLSGDSLEGGDDKPIADVQVGARAYPPEASMPVTGGQIRFQPSKAFRDTFYAREPRHGTYGWVQIGRGPPPVGAKKAIDAVSGYRNGLNSRRSDYARDFLN